MKLFQVQYYSIYQFQIFLNMQVMTALSLM